MSRITEPSPEYHCPTDSQVVAALFGETIDFASLPELTLTSVVEAARIHITGASALNMVNYAVSKGLPFSGRITFVRGLSKFTVGAINGGECRFHIDAFVAPYNVNPRKLSHCIDFRSEHISGAIQVESATCGAQKIVDSNDVFHILGVAENQTNIPKAVVYYYRPQMGRKTAVSLLDYQREAGRILEPV